MICINLQDRQNISWLLFAEERRFNGVAEAWVHRPGPVTQSRMPGCCCGGRYRRSLPHDDIPEEEGIESDCNSALNVNLTSWPCYNV